MVSLDYAFYSSPLRNLPSQIPSTVREWVGTFSNIPGMVSLTVKLVFNGDSSKTKKLQAINAVETIINTVTLLNDVLTPSLSSTNLIAIQEKLAPFRCWRISGQGHGIFAEEYFSTTLDISIDSLSDEEITSLQTNMTNVVMNNE